MNIQSIGNFSATQISSIGKESKTPVAVPAQQSITIEDSVGPIRSFELSPTRAGIFQVMMPSSLISRMEETPSEEPAVAQTQQTQAPSAEATSEEVADYCNTIAKSSMSLEERSNLITDALAVGIEKAEAPECSWEKATKEQLGLYVMETLEHVDAVRSIGDLRGLDFGDHDLEEKTGKFTPEIAQFLALPGRSDSVQWAIQKHNGSQHHAVWHDSSATTEELSESASDIVNAWRMNRRVYNKPPWSWERITQTIETQFQYNDLSVNQRDALLEAIPYQMDYEHSKGIDIA